MSEMSAKGTALEHEMIAELVRDGNYLAKSVDPQCPFDMIAVSPEGQIRLIDVKTKSIRQTGKRKGSRINRVLSLKQKEFKEQTGLTVELLII